MQQKAKNIAFVYEAIFFVIIIYDPRSEVEFRPNLKNSCGGPASLNDADEYFMVVSYTSNSEQHKLLI